MLLISRYTLRSFLGMFLICVIVVFGVVSMIDILELMRRSANKPNVSFDIILVMAGYKMPRYAHQQIPVAILFATMLTFWRLTRTHELVVIRSFGLSVWRFSSPVLLASLVLALLHMTTLQPLSVFFLDRYVALEKQYIKGINPSVFVSSSGLWLRQSQNDQSYLIHIQNSNTFEQVKIFQFDAEQRYLGRIDAERILLQPGAWVIEQGILRPAQEPARLINALRIPTQLTREQITDSLIRSENISFWTLPTYINSLEQAGLSSIKHALYYQDLLTTIVKYPAIVLLGLVFSLKLPRMGGLFFVIVCGIASGLGFFFLTEIISQLAETRVLSPILAAWFPPTIVFLFSSSLLLYQEDG